MFPSQFANILFTDQTFVTNLHPLRVELRCKLQEKLHCVTGPLIADFNIKLMKTKRKNASKVSYTYNNLLYSFTKYFLVW